MMRAFWRSYGWLLLMTVLVTVFTTVYLLAGVSPSPLAMGIMSLAMPLSFLAWVELDSRSRRCSPCYDFGLFLIIFGCFALPIYLLWSRGVMGIPVAIMFFVLLMLPSIVAVILSVFVSVLAG